MALGMDGAVARLGWPTVAVLLAVDVLLAVALWALLSSGPTEILAAVVQPAGEAWQGAAAGGSLSTTAAVGRCDKWIAEAPILT